MERAFAKVGENVLSDAVITAIIVAVSSIVCQVLINRNNRNKRSKEETDKAQQKAIESALESQKLDLRLKSIEDKLEIHNNYAERLADIAKSIAVIENDIKNLYKGAKAS